MKVFQRLFALLLSLCLVNATLIQTAHAALVSTEEVARQVAADQGGTGRARLAATLARGDVRAALESQGVEPARALERVAALTDEEAGQLADQINSAPAGGIIGAILLVFFVLLVTDILGLTKVFPFTRSHR